MLSRFTKSDQHTERHHSGEGWPVEAAGPVEAKNAPTRSLENGKTRFPQLPQALEIDLDQVSLK
jgi:hypothetical protein